MEPKTWTKQEVIAIIVKAFRDTREDCVSRKVPFTFDAGAEQAVADLDELCLLEFTP